LREKLEKARRWAIFIHRQSGDFLVKLNYEK